ncbi:MAG: AI-2E family transporter [Verrucomicrobia bacterium]|nr:AI-2E family transporter [Verrucomicrobiota bacterium]
MRNPAEDGQADRFSYRDGRRLLVLIVLLIVIWMLLRALVGVLLLFGIVILLAMVLNPLIVQLERFRIRRSIGVAIVLVALAALVVLIIAIAVPTFADQLQLLVSRAPKAWQSIRTHIADVAQRYPALQNALPQADQIATTVGNQAGAMANVLLRSTLGLVGGVFVFVFAVLLLIFVLANPEPLVVAYLALVPARHRPRAERTLVRMMEQMTAWARGVAINGVITGASTGILLWLVGVQPAFVFGVLAFIGEFLPNIGPVLVAFPVLFVALSLSLTKFWLALAAILFVQQVEANVLVPYILGKEMRLNPVLILFFTIAMGWLFGLAGAILALPAASLTKIAIEEFYLRPRGVDYSSLEPEASRIIRNESAHDTVPPP